MVETSRSTASRILSRSSCHDYIAGSEGEGSRVGPANVRRSGEDQGPPEVSQLAGAPEDVQRAVRVLRVRQAADEDEVEAARRAVDGSLESAGADEGDRAGLTAGSVLDQDEVGRRIERANEGPVE